MNIKPRKNQKCCVCGKSVENDWAYNGKWYCGKCKDKDTKRIIKEYIKSLE